MSDIQRFSIEQGVTIEQATYMCRKASLFCKCGKFRKVRKSSQSFVGIALDQTCGDKECNPRYGVKRPDHSVKMKALASTPNSRLSKVLKKKGDINPFFNSEEFKFKAASNAGIDIEGKSPEQAFSEYMSARMRGTKYREKMISRRIENWPDWAKEIFLSFYPTGASEAIIKYGVDEVYARSHGIQTLVNDKNTGRNSWFKSEFVTNLKFNSSGLTAVKTRSGWESTAIRLFEKLEIPWEYETIRLRTKKGTYTPDFKIIYNNSTWLIEIKGGFYRVDGEEYMANQIQAAKDFCRQLGWKFALVFNEPIDLKTIFEGELKWD